MHQDPKKDQFVNCAVYTRVSVDERAATQAYSTLDNQRDSCLSYIESQKSEGWRVFKVYEDSGQSGGSLNRPAMKQLMHDIKKKLIQVVVVYKIDRLTRSHRDFYSLLEVFNENGVSFVSTTQHFETNSPAGRLLLHMMLEFAQFEREMAQERTYDKRIAMARKGMYCGGRVPLGYDSKDKKLIINPEEAKIVQLCFELYPKLGSMGRVSKKLNEMGYRTKKFYDKSKKNSGSRGSIKFDKKKVSTILANPLYIGKVRFMDKSKKIYLFEGEHEPIIKNPKVWDGAQNQIVSNRETRKSFKQNKYEMLFQGLIRCGECGSTMTNSSKRKNGKVYLYYRCVEAIARGADHCSIRNVSGDEIEELLIAEFKALGKNQTLLRKSIEKANGLAKKGLAPLQREKDAVEAQLTKINGDLKRLVNIMKSEDMPQKRVQTLLSEMSDLEESKEKLEYETHRIHTNMHHLSRHVIDAETFTKLFTEFPAVFDTFDFEERRKLIVLLVKEVIYTPVKITVKFWGDLPEMAFDIKNPPDWTPPPNDDGDNPSPPTGPHSDGGEAKGRAINQVRSRVSNGCPAWARTRNLASKGQCDTISPPGNIFM
jgi:site-specific DNA recombinase